MFEIRPPLLTSADDSTPPTLRAASRRLGSRGIGSSGGAENEYVGVSGRVSAAGANRRWRNRQHGDAKERGHRDTARISLSGGWTLLRRRARTRRHHHFRVRDWLHLRIHARHAELRRIDSCSSGSPLGRTCTAFGTRTMPCVARTTVVSGPIRTVRAERACRELVPAQMP